MNPSTILGMLLAVVIVALGVFFTTENPLDLLDLPSLVLVVGGTIAATLISYPLREVLRVFGVFMIVLRNDAHKPRDDLNEIVRCSKLYFQGDIVSIDAEPGKQKNPFLRMGVQNERSGE